MIERFRKRKSSMQNNYLTFVFFCFSSAASDTTHNHYGNTDVCEVHLHSLRWHVIHDKHNIIINTMS